MITRIRRRGHYFGFIRIFGDLYFTTDPIGWFVWRIQQVEMNLKKKQRYEVDLWDRWDRFYRCRLKIPMLIHRWSEGNA